MYNYPSYYPYPSVSQNPNTIPNPNPASPQNADNGIVWVQGEAGAKSYLVNAGRSVLLMDSEENKFYIKSADISGMPLPLRIFTYTEERAENTPNNSVSDNNKDYITRQEFEAKIAEITGKKAKKETKENKDSE